MQLKVINRVRIVNMFIAFEANLVLVYTVDIKLTRGHLDTA